MATNFKNNMTKFFAEIRKTRTSSIEAEEKILAAVIEGKAEHKVEVRKAIGSGDFNRANEIEAVVWLLTDGLIDEAEENLDDMGW